MAYQSEASFSGDDDAERSEVSEVAPSEPSAPAVVRHFAFTYFGEGKEEHLSFPFLDWMLYLIYQHEICPQTGKPHLQGYVQVKLRKSTKVIAKEFKGIFIQPARASAQHNIAYCSKTDTRDPNYPDVFQFGKPRGIISSKTLADVAQMVKSGTPYRELLYNDEIPADILMLNRRHIIPFEADFARNRVRNVKCTFIFGNTGTGKSHIAWLQADDPDQVYQPVIQEGQPLWFDNYLGQSIILLDDLAPNTIGRNTLLRICDKWPFPIPVKGSRTNANWTQVIITSNFNLDAFDEAFDRRIHNLVRMPCKERCCVLRGKIITSRSEKSVVEVKASDCS